MKIVFAGLLMIASVSTFAMSFGQFSVHCDLQREAVKEIDKTLTAKNSTAAVKEAYFDHVYNAIQRSINCSQLSFELRNILRAVESEN